MAEIVVGDEQLIWRWMKDDEAQMLEYIAEAG